MQRVIIFGARPDGHAKVVLEILRAQGGFDIIGFVDDDPLKRGIRIGGLPVLGAMSDMSWIKDTYFLNGAIVAIGDNASRRRLAGILEAMGLELINAVHPTAHLDSDVRMGKGNVICQGVIVITGSNIGNCVNLHTSVTVDHDNCIDDGANLGPGVHTAGRVHICRDAFLGTGAVVIPDGIIGEGAIVGAGSVVIRPVAPRTKVLGVPARPVSTSERSGHNPQ